MYRVWSKSDESCDQQTYQTQVYSAIFCGLTQTKTCRLIITSIKPHYVYRNFSRTKFFSFVLFCFFLLFQGWGENDRGVSFTFGPDVVSKFLNRHDMDLICRAHQVVEDGYEFFAKRQLVTLFSAPNYCGEFDNAGGMMSVDENLMCSFQVRT